MRNEFARTPEFERSTFCCVRCSRGSDQIIRSAELLAHQAIVPVTLAKSIFQPLLHSRRLGTDTRHSCGRRTIAGVRGKSGRSSHMKVGTERSVTRRFRPLLSCVEIDREEFDAFTGDGCRPNGW